jgi:undecaprenyl pyrophosphate phosphatase UppP
MIASAITGFLAVWGLLKILAKATFNGFALYRVMAAIGIFIVLFVR